MSSIPATEAYLAQFDPHRDAGDWVVEDPYDYAVRMQASVLQNWPTEVLVEWFHRHAGHIYDYAFLRFELFRFRRETWPLSQIPGKEVFADPRFADSFSNVEERARDPYDWLARYMIENGTWNSPPILLKTPRKDLAAPGGWTLRYPLHLLEGHRRVSFLSGLRLIGKAHEYHDVWLVGLASEFSA